MNNTSVPIVTDFPRKRQGFGEGEGIEYLSSLEKSKDALQESLSIIHNCKTSLLGNINTIKENLPKKFVEVAIVEDSTYKLIKQINIDIQGSLILALRKIEKEIETEEYFLTFEPEKRREELNNIQQFQARELVVDELDRLSLTTNSGDFEFIDSEVASLIESDWLDKSS